MITIIYGDIAVGAKEAFDVSETTKELSGISQKNQILQNISIGNYENPIEKYSVILDDLSMLPQKNMQDTNSGFWSEFVSAEDGTFDSPIIIELVSEESFKTHGITLEFDSYSNFYPTSLSIELYLSGALQETFNFSPDEYRYFCDFQKDIEYDKTIITVYSLNAPYNRLKIRSLVFGEGTSFLSNEIKNISISHKIDISSLTLPIGTANIKLKTLKANDLNFEEQQPLTVISNENIETKTYIKSAKRINKTDFDIIAESEISLLDGVDFVGGVYTNKNAYELYNEIFTASNSLAEIDESFKNISVSGYLPYSTCRTALQQLAFATNGVVITPYIEGIKVVPYDSIIKSSVKNIGLGRLKSQGVDAEKSIKAITLTAHKYSQEETELKTIFEDKGTINEATEIFVKLNTPHYDFDVINGTKIESGDNFIKAIANSGCKILAKEYKHTTSQKTLILNEKSKTAKSVSNATLVSAENIDKVLEKCYNYYSRNKKGKMKIIDIERIKVGDILNVKTLYSRDVQGVVISQNYSVVGNTFVKDTEVLGG